MKYLWLAGFAVFTEGQTNDARNRETVRNQVVGENCTQAFVAGGDQDTGGTCRGAADVAAYTEDTMFASMGNYMANTGLLACDTWRGDTTCQSGICFCTEEGVCAVNGQCGGRIGTMTCGGTSNGLPCQFPFTYLTNDPYDACTTDGSPPDAPYSWCYVAGGARWGKCDCQEDCADTENYIDVMGFNCSSWDGFYCPGARMYGFNSSGIEQLLLNCPLTCRECFPPAAVPGSGDTVEYFVRGSVSFTVQQDQADNFVADSGVEDALGTAMYDLAGDLAVGVPGITFETGGDVEGLTVFCELTDCAVGEVLKLVLPDSCAGSACTSTECCTSPPTCAAAACSGATHVLKSSPEACETAECQQEECCDFRAVCSPNVCDPTSHVMMEDTALCELAVCGSSECCEPRGQCGTAGAPAPAPSGGPSAGPVAFSADWAGCPAVSHVDMATADLPDLCEGARCSIWECCDLRDTCNVTSACDADTMVPRDRDGIPCAAAECDVTDCCEERDECEAADCTDLVADGTHVLKAGTTMCWGAECTQTECCELRAACTIAICGNTSDTDRRPNPWLSQTFKCAGTSCDEGECCEWYFDGYSRSSMFYLTSANADVDEYDTPSDAHDACEEGSALDCAGFVCEADSNGVAIGPCLLKGTGPSMANGFTEGKVGFLGVSCAESFCGEDYVLKDDLPDTCDPACSESLCCDIKGDCDNYTCPDSHIAPGSITDSVLCQGATCLLGECCSARDICAAGDCPSESHLPLAALPLFCDGTDCQEDECCVARAECTGAVCGNTHVLKPSALLNFFLADGLCAGAECTLGECCNPRPACRESVCDPTEEVFQPSVALCSATTCTKQECCASRAMCDASACGSTHVLLPDGDSGRVELCETDQCTPEECCAERGQCSRETCDTDAYLMADYPSLCEDATCTSAECCAICPFEGNWQSTSVFGGDALAITAAPVVNVGDSGWEVLMVAMPSVSFGFVIERTSESTAECQCKIMLDQFTVAAGVMAESQDNIAWDMILNSDVWERQSRRLDAKPDAKRNYEIKEDGSIVVFSRERRLQMQDVRMDFEFVTATDNDAVQLKGRFEEMELWEIEDALRNALANSNFTIGSVYMADGFETETIVTPGRTTSWAARSADCWTWMPVSAAVAALLFT